MERYANSWNSITPAMLRFDDLDNRYTMRNTVASEKIRTVFCGEPDDEYWVWDPYFYTSIRLKADGTGLVKKPASPDSNASISSRQELSSSWPKR